MSACDTLSLELLHVAPEHASERPPLLFVHGAYVGAWCWAEHFLPYFADRGWDAYAVSLSGHGKSPGHEYLDALSIDDYVRDVHEAIAVLPKLPIIVGHSMGGFILQRLLEKISLPAAVLLCSVPPRGMWATTLGLAFQRPGLLYALTRFAGGGPIGPDALRDALFYQPVSPALLERYFFKMHNESQRAVWDMQGFVTPKPMPENCPHRLVLGAEFDALVSQADVYLTAAGWEVEPQIIPGIGHGVMLEQGWESAASRIADWLDGITF